MPARRLDMTCFSNSDAAQSSASGKIDPRENIATSRSFRIEVSQALGSDSSRSSASKAHRAFPCGSAILIA